MCAFERGDGAQGVQQPLRVRGQGGRGGGVHARDGRKLTQCGGVDAGVLADVERLQVQAVGADLQQQRIDQHGCEP